MTRQELEQLGDAVLEALAAGTLLDSGLVAEGVRCTENGAEVELGEGVWSTVETVGYRQVFTDPEPGPADGPQQVAVFAVVREADDDTIVGLRLGVDDAGRVAEVETLVSRRGQSSIFGPHLLADLDPVLTEALPADADLDRATLVAAADRYFDDIEHNRTDSVFHPACQRFENGVQTTGNPEVLGGTTCAQQFAYGWFGYIEQVRGRRYPLVDVERGLVFAVVFLDVPGTVTHLELGSGRRVELPKAMRFPRSTLLFEVFKVVPADDEASAPTGGVLRAIEAVMVNLDHGAPHGWE